MSAQYALEVVLRPGEDALPWLDQLDDLRSAAGLRVDLCRYWWQSKPDGEAFELTRREGVWCWWGHRHLRPHQVVDKLVTVVAEGTEEEIAAWHAARRAAGWRDVSTSPNEKEATGT